MRPSREIVMAPRSPPLIPSATSIIHPSSSTSSDINPIAACSSPSYRSPSVNATASTSASATGTTLSNSNNAVAAVVDVAHAARNGRAVVPRTAFSIRAPPRSFAQHSSLGLSASPSPASAVLQLQDDFEDIRTPPFVSHSPSIARIAAPVVQRAPAFSRLVCHDPCLSPLDMSIVGRRRSASSSSSSSVSLSPHFVSPPNSVATNDACMTPIDTQYSVGHSSLRSSPQPSVASSAGAERGEMSSYPRSCPNHGESNVNDDHHHTGVDRERHESGCLTNNEGVDDGGSVSPRMMTMTRTIMTTASMTNGGLSVANEVAMASDGVIGGEGTGGGSVQSCLVKSKPIGIPSRNSIAEAAAEVAAECHAVQLRRDAHQHCTSQRQGRRVKHQLRARNRPTSPSMSSSSDSDY